MSDFDFDEIARLEAVLNEATPKAVAMAKLAVKKTGFDTVALAQEFAPVDTGHLKSSIGVDFDEDELGFVAGPTASYGRFVELGTSMIAPQPYLGPAFDLAVEAFIPAIEQIGGRAFE